MLERRLGLILGVASLASPALSQAPPRLVFTAIPDQDETRLMERFRRVVAYLQGALGVPVQYVPVKNYAAAVCGFHALVPAGRAGSAAARGPRGLRPRSLA